MTDATIDADAAAGADAPARKRLSGKKLVLFVVLPAILLLAGGGAAAWFLLSGDAAPAGEEAQSDPKNTDAAKVVFYELPEMLVNLNTGGKQTSYLRIRIALELEGAETAAKIEAVLPRVVDHFQVYLRELRVEDLNGSAGMVRLKEELLTRVAAAAQGAKVNDVLFKEMLIQ